MARHAERERLQREGPFLTRWRLRLSDDRKRLRDWWRFTVLDLPGTLRAFWQRGRRGWADRDTSSFHRYLARVLGGALPHLAAHGHSYPLDTPDFETWADHLRTMGRAFAAYGADCHGDWLDAVLAARTAPDRALAWEIAEAETSEIDEATAMLAFWFQSLWS